MMGLKPRAAGVARGVALLRGINVGGHRLMPMAELREVFESMGCGSVATYIQSGNVAFDCERGLTEGEVARVIEGRFGFWVPVMVRTAGELERVVVANPFLGSKDPAHLHVGFCTKAPEAGGLEAARFLPDEFRVVGREVFLCTPGGMSKTKLSASFFKGLGEPCTVRNWRTVNKLLEMTRNP